MVVATPKDRVFVLWNEEVLLNNTASKDDILLSKGQIPQEYTEPYRQVSYVMMPVEPYNPVLGIVVAIGTSVAAGVGAALYYRHRKKGRL